MKQTNRKPLEFKTAKPGTPSAKIPVFEPQHKEFLDFVATGHSIGDAAALVGATRAAYEKWRNRVEGFRAAVAAARESHRRDIACGLHGADAYARMLLDALQRDESLPAPLRYRASKTILTRKGKTDWLPDPIPASTEPLAPYDDEQPESLTNDFLSHPKRSNSKSAESATASRGQELSESASVTGDQVEPRESANGAIESCCHGQSEPASVARGNAHSTLQAPQAAAELVTPQPPVQSSQIPDEPKGSPFLAPEAAQPSATKASAAANSTPEAGSRKPEAGSRKPEAVRAPASTPNPDNPDKPDTAQAVANSMKNQQDPPAKTIPMGTLEFFGNPDSQTSATKASAAANATPEAVLSQQWLGTYFLHQHESPKAFERLLANHIHAYAPANAPEELLVFRITQKSWLLRRVETWERVIADSRVAKIREKHPNAAAPACIAMSLLEVKESNQTRFYERTAKLRKQHEDALDRLESKLFAAQQRREVRSSQDEWRRRPSIDAPACRGSHRAKAA